MIHIFVINNFAGNSDLAKDLREHLAERNNIRYFVFNTLNKGYERDIVQKVCKFFKGEKLRFYCCGGSGTMMNMLNGFDDLTDVEIAFFPCGLTNDFLKCFDDITPFKNIDNLIDGQVVPIDYIQTNHGIALNTLSIGFDSNVIKAMGNYRILDIFGSQIPYFLSLVNGVLFAKSKSMEITIDGVASPNKYLEVVYGNGRVLGGNIFFGIHNDVQDGIGSYLTITSANKFEAIRNTFKLLKKDHTNLSSKITFGDCSTIEIKNSDNSPVYVNYDGELTECENGCQAKIVKNGLNFVIPQNIEINETLFD